MPVLLGTHYRLARTAIKENRTRSFLTCLGIAIGVASIILILSLMGSISKLVSDEVNEIGDNLIVVRPETNKDIVTDIVDQLTSANSFQKSNLSLSDVEKISEVDNITAVAPIAIATTTATTEKNTIPSVSILGTNEDFLKIESLSFQAGSFINNQNKAHSIVLGHDVSINLFGTFNSTVGQMINIMGEKYMVVGVLSEVDRSINFDNVDFNNAIIMDAEALTSAVGSIQIQQINILAANTDSLAQASEDISSTLIEHKGGDQNFNVAYGDQITHPASSLFTIISSMLTLVAGISLVVGGIGVMNIMLVSVSERKHEIGVRKAVGASSRNILMQFLLEALILAFIGGIMGLLLGYALAFLLSTITPFAPYISWEIIVITFVMTYVVGTIFGIIPAIKAASKNPIDSLKHYR